MTNIVVGLIGLAIGVALGWLIAQIARVPARR